MATLDDRDKSKLDSIEVVHERALPDVYVVDKLGRVQIARIGGVRDGSIRGARYDGLPDAIAPIVVELLKRRRHDSPDQVFVDPKISHVVHLSAMVGDLGSYTAVFVSPFKTRDHLTSAMAKYGLSKREGQVVTLLAAGWRTQEIARELKIAVSTVVLHVKSAMSKSQSHSRIEMIVRVLAPHVLRANPSRREAN